MKIQKVSLIGFTFLTVLLQTSWAQKVKIDAEKPFLGWNSWDSYGLDINEKYAKENLDAFICKLKPFGYEYFVLDAGWYEHHDLKEDEKWPTDGDKSYINIDDYGRHIPSKVLFPNGFNDIIEHARKHGVKFGLHVMRGIPREAVKKNTIIKGTNYHAQDIADITDTCSWSPLMYGVDMNKPGAQEYYNSILELHAGWGVEFIKYDDIVHKPREIDAVVNARDHAGAKIVLSLSPGQDINPEYLETYKKTEMIRITGDVWDEQNDIEKGFESWEKLVPYGGQGFWLDLDMIPFGHLKVNTPLTHNILKANRGYERMDRFNYDQKKTFMTQRAMAASPLFFGGAITTSPNFVFEVITNADMLECNQNGVVGHLVKRYKKGLMFSEIWQTPHKSIKNTGWIGLFNRGEYTKIMKLSKEELALNPELSYSLYEIWDKRLMKDEEPFFFEIPPHGVVFIKYMAK
ncbi:glycoside hydrolase family 27 protein [Mariniphaga sediminis]|uniref:glycoside hydrolase family 27 protein n=1 Tax=Mariniphaga sediminis TaxID=1628158 RepID=UPI003564F788